MQFGFMAGIAFHPDLQLFVWQPRGVLDEPHVEQIIAMLEEAEDKAEMPFDRFTDLSMLASVEVCFEYIFRISLYRRVLYTERPPVKSAFYVVDQDTARVALTHAVVTDGSPLNVKVFLNRAAAAEWLEVEEEFLEVTD